MDVYLPPIIHAAVQPEASTCLAKEVLGSRKSVRRGKLPLPASYDLLLQLFGEHASQSPLPVA